MSSIEKRGSTYKITVSCGYDSEGKKLRKTMTWEPPEGLTARQTDKALQAAAVAFEAKVKSGHVLDSNMRLSDLVEHWRKEYAANNLEPTTLESYNWEMDTKILPALGHFPLNKLKPVHILSFLNNLLEDGCRMDGKPGGYSNRTVKYQHRVLSSVLQTAVEWQMLADNPCSRVKVPKKKREGVEQGIKYFTDDQAIRFLAHVDKCDLKHQALVYLAIFGGLRKGEVLGLSWSDIDLSTGKLSVRRSLAYLPDRGLFFKPTKTASSTRDLYLPSVVLDILRRYKAEQDDDIQKLGELWHHNNYVFTQQNGEPMHTSAPRQWFARLLRTYNLSIGNDPELTPERKAELKLPIIPFHGLRHTAATLMIANNTDVRTVSARLGHAQTSTTLNIYSHALQKSDKVAADALEVMLGKAPKKAPRKVGRTTKKLVMQRI